METENYLDLPLFIGSWYVIASDPNFLEKDHLDAIEPYTFRGNGNIDIDYSYTKMDESERVHILQLEIPLSDST